MSSATDVITAAAIEHKRNDSMPGLQNNDACNEN